MIKLYRYRGGDKIEEKTAIRETAHFWIFPGWANRGETREAKVQSGYYGNDSWTRTPQETIQNFINATEMSIMSYKTRLAEYEKKYAIAKEQLALFEAKP